MGKNVEFDLKAQNKTDTAFKQVKKNLASVDKGLLSMTKALAGIGAGVAGLYAVGKGLETVVGAANKQIEAETNLNSVLEATGHAAGKSLADLKNMAAGLQDLTTYGDETTLTGMSILATFKNIRGEAFDRTTRAALDMSTVLKQDLSSSMLMLGKALNEPKTGLTALTRAGVTFTEQQKEIIGDMIEFGDVAGAQGIILKELESQFGGAAEAAGGPFDKALQQLINTFGDLLEEIGFGIVENDAFIELLQEGKVAIQDMIPYVAGLVDEFVYWIGPVDQLKGRLDTFLNTVRTMIAPLKAAWSLLNAVGSAIGTGAAVVYTGAEKLASSGISIPGVSDVEEYATGTGARGLPRDGLYYGHKGEVVSNKNQSSGMVQGTTININVSPQFMTGDRSAARTVAQEIKKELTALNIRWGTS